MVVRIIRFVRCITVVTLILDVLCGYSGLYFADAESLVKLVFIRIISFIRITSVCHLNNKVVT